MLKLLITLSTITSTFASVWPVNSKGDAIAGSIETFYVDPQQLWQNRELYNLGRKDLNGQIKTIKAFSDAAILDNTIYTVTAKPTAGLPPSGDIHDFYSLSRYYWPSPNSSVYTRIDGSVNPEIYKVPDTTYFRVVKQDVFKLALTYFFTGDEKYALKATQRLRDWYITPATAMNPNMNYASWVIGSSPGTVFTGNATGNAVSGGLLDLKDIYMIIDAIGLIRSSKSFGDADYQAIVAWFNAFLTWSKTSLRGINEAGRTNNLGVWFDGMQATICLFLGLSNEAATIQLRALSRLDGQIAADGSEPLETIRADSWDYSIFNLRAHFLIGQLSPSTNISYFTYTTPTGKSLLNALNYVVQYSLVLGDGWPFANANGFSPNYVIQLCRYAYVQFKDAKYSYIATELQLNYTKVTGLESLWAPYGAYLALSDGLQVQSSFLGMMIVIVATVYFGY